MAYKAPTPAGQGHQGDWYVPVIGMGAGSVIGDGMQALKSQWADTLRLLSGRASLPTTENIAKMTGGLEQPGSQVIKDLNQIRTQAGDPHAADLLERGVPAHEFGRMVGKTRTGPMLRPSVDNVGGMIPDKEVLDRVMNAGMRDKILGMGAVMPMLPPPGVEQGGRNDILSRLLGISYPGYKINSPNSGNASQNDQLRQLGFGQ